MELSNIDYNKCSLDELRAEISRLKSLNEEYYNLEQSIKIFINSVYGAIGSPFFSYYNVNIAEAVTLQGQDVAKYASKCIDEYFFEYWHKDKELHKQLGLNYVNKINEKTLTIYMDTDSVDAKSIVNTTNGIKTIEEWYNENKSNENEFTVLGHQSVKTSDKILNWSPEKGLYYADVVRIIKHSVIKPKWQLKTKSNKSILITNDHSLIIFNENKAVKVKPEKIVVGDKILCVNDSLEFYFDEVEYCERVGNFNSEYVYDVEVFDETHTFIANDILVHNSCYVTYDPVLKSCDYNGNPIDFFLKIKELRLNSFLNQKFEEYAKKYHTKNIQNLELEKISYSAIMIAKKKYILDLAWKDPGVYINPQDKIKFVGIEIVQGSTPKYARKVLREMIKMICNQKKKLDYSGVVKQLKEYKREYSFQMPEDIAKTQAIGDYEKYCIEDRKQIKLALKCPQNVRAAAVYNHILLNSKWKTKYNLIKTGDKIKYYYTMDENEVFAFLPGNYPYEFAPPVNYDLQFEKTIIEPFNRILETMGFNPIPGNLIYSKNLF